ncbi:tRNA (uracil-5-)-methyltransferase Gid [Desulfoplanes formicivorans]|uniref:Methylenetetrahydrofolate--tRNA-(uracil-5-)-methyltransferase TrmFO n=1 Tax=Desulfoplanes formicivorans TaxID=1592317 RepID=A0A194ACY2_9BACT|nr:tRNA (uracil-5-)-methyltransferase Gid [Desulfoplanes formicivorans]
MSTPAIAVIGGGLAGSEAAYQLARSGVPTTLFEMKPVRFSPAHNQEGLAELVCSNSLRSTDPESGIGLLKQEMELLESVIMQVARHTAIPAGKALAVDRRLFSTAMTEQLERMDHLTIVRKEITSLDDPDLEPFAKVIIAAGPLASPPLTASLMEAAGEEDLYFYDAIAPIVVTESIDMDKAFWGSRYHPEEKDYLNCPLNEEEYTALVQALKQGTRVKPREFEQAIHFDGCLPIETMADRGDQTLAFGPLKPVGLIDPRTGKQPFACVQLRSENRDKTAMNMVGFQTKLTYPEQQRIFSMIPGLEHAEFERMGSIHRNTFVNAPKVLTPQMELKNKPGFFLAGQITGVEGYLESAATGLWLGLFLAGRITSLPPVTTALGALLNHLQTPAKKFQPSNVNFGLMPGLNRRASKKDRKKLYAARAVNDFTTWLQGEPRT